MTLKHFLYLHGMTNFNVVDEIVHVIVILILMLSFTRIYILIINDCKAYITIFIIN